VSLGEPLLTPGNSAGISPLPMVIIYLGAETFPDALN